MNNLLKKELKLALHPTAPMFLALSAMLMIPNYPYLVAFFYTGLGVFFTCLLGRENDDVGYTLLLPVSKRDVVRARFTVVTVLQLLQLLAAVPFAVLRQKLIPAGNLAGLDANIALFGFAFVLYGGFNLIFFSVYYRDVRRVGMAFIWSSVWVFLWIGLVETCTHLVPLMRERIDTPDPAYLPEKLVILAVGLAVYVLLTGLAYCRTTGLFEKQDL
ncbi:MAG: ABC-2 transporter permease [Hominenteromicrobium sp.]